MWSFCRRRCGVPSIQTNSQLNHERPRAVYFDRSDTEWRQHLSPEQYAITRQGGGTEQRAFSSVYWNHKDPGAYRYACCGADPFSSEAKFDLAPDGRALGKV